MTSKEAFKELKENAQEICEWELVRLNIIEKDLEVLNIIKRSFYSRESHKYVLNEKLKGQKFMNVSLCISGDTDYNKVMEWLDNE